MNYQKIYNQIINRAKKRVLTTYKEHHHIRPRCMGGNDEPDNIAELTSREHFICHKLLTRIYPNEHKLQYALWMMSIMKNIHGRDYTVGSREYQKLREQFSKNISELHTGKEVSNDTRKKISEGLCGIIRTDRHNENASLSRIGKRKSKETKKKMSIAKRNMSDETKKKMSKSFTGRVLKKSTREKISNYRKGKTHTTETIKMMKTLAKKRCSVTIKCPHCDKKGAKPIMKRWHFDNCKHREK